MLTLSSTLQAVTNDLAFICELIKNNRQMFEYVLEDNEKKTYHAFTEKLAKLWMKTLCDLQKTFAQTLHR